MFQLVVHLHSLPVLTRVLTRACIYRAHPSGDSIRSYQLERFNAVWRDAYTNVPFYKKWKNDHQLPDAIDHLSQLNGWPIVSKKDFQLSKDLLYREGVKPTGRFLTGGSTGEPMSMPTWTDCDTSPSLYVAHAGLGYNEGDRTFHMWGHRHLYGKGLHRQIAIFKQRIKDAVLNRYRYPSYDLSEDAMRDAYNKFRKFNPIVFSGFSAAVLAFCRINRQIGNLNTAKIKLVLCTAGPLSSDERREISEYFNAPVCMEYGSADCSLMAYTGLHDETYHTFWETHLLQGVRDENGEVSNIVTRLTDCYIPIIRYCIGDYLDVARDCDLDSVLTMRAVKGRPSDIVRLPNGVSFFGAIIGDCVKQVNGVVSSQLIVDGSLLEIDVVAIRPLVEDDFDLIKKRFVDVVKGAATSDVSVRQVSEVVRTTAGKMPLVVRR